MSSLSPKEKHRKLALIAEYKNSFLLNTKTGAVYRWAYPYHFLDHMVLCDKDGNRILEQNNAGIGQGIAGSIPEPTLGNPDSSDDLSEHDSGDLLSEEKAQEFLDAIEAMGSKKALKEWAELNLDYSPDISTGVSATAVRAEITSVILDKA